MDTNKTCSQLKINALPLVGLEENVLMCLNTELASRSFMACVAAT